MLDIANNTDGSNVLVVVHGAFLGQFYLKWEAHNNFNRDERSRIPNCSIFKYTFKDNTFILEDIIEHDFSAIE